MKDLQMETTVVGNATRYYVMAVTPTRIYSFTGICSLETVFASYSDRAIHFMELPGEIPNSEPHFFIKQRRAKHGELNLELNTVSSLVRAGAGGILPLSLSLSVRQALCWIAVVALCLPSHALLQSWWPPAAPLSSLAAMLACCWCSSLLTSICSLLLLQFIAFGSRD